jgi:hypothetical protein
MVNGEWSMCGDLPRAGSADDLGKPSLIDQRRLTIAGPIVPVSPDAQFRRGSVLTDGD